MKAFLNYWGHMPGLPPKSTPVLKRDYSDLFCFGDVVLIFKYTSEHVVVVSGCLRCICCTAILTSRFHAPHQFVSERRSGVVASDPCRSSCFPAADILTCVWT